MIKMVCDRCGKEIVLTYRSPNEPSKLTTPYTSIQYDLCKNCIVEVRDFIEQGKRSEP